MSDDYDFRSELGAFCNSRLFEEIKTRLLNDYKQKLADIPSSDYLALVAQKRKIEALNDLIGTMRHLHNETALEELNARN